MNNLELILYIAVFTLANADNLEITIKQGILRGKKATSRNGRTFNSFTGIPYAKPPINRLRFQPSVAAEEWKGIFDATKPHKRCLQINNNLKNDTVIGSEDCLYLNVYTPTTQPDEALPVMFFIHGGAFATGSGIDYDPSLLMDHDVVLVTINYRLGPFGFLTTTSYHLLGNDGLKDQALALKWVKDNIQEFGGDSNKITVFGHGAGGVSAHLHMLSPLTKDLISGVIAQSGTALAHNAITPLFLSVRYTKFLVERLDCPVHNEMDDMMRCLMFKNGKSILEKTIGFKEWDIEPVILFGPVIEPALPDAFLSEDPAQIILKGKAANVPFMTGITTNEGDLRTTLLFKSPEMIDELNAKIDDYLPLLLSYKNVAIYKNVKPATKSIKEFYFNDEDISEGNKKDFSKMYTDGLYLFGANFAVDLHLKGSKQPVYYYVFGYKGSESYCNLYGSTENGHGVCHSDDLLYLFNDIFNFPDLKRSKADNEVVDVVTKLWTSFARNGNASPNWNPFTLDKPNHYFIKDGDNMANILSVFKKRTHFWKMLILNEKRGEIRDEL